MTRTKTKRPWICRHGHPMWKKPVSGHWICHTCNDMNLNHGGAKFSLCAHGHKRVVNTDCRVCRNYQLTPWLLELDLNGTALCPAGHEVSHHDDSVEYVKSKRHKARYCRRCLRESIQKARSVMPDHRQNPMCRNKLHPRTEENTRLSKTGHRQCKPCWETAQAQHLMKVAIRKEKKSDLKPAYVDWVVVERMLAKGQMDYIRRGKHVGPTDGERWVAYCTFVKNAGGRHPEDLYGEPGYDSMQLWKFSGWKELGRKYKWREFTLDDLRAIISEPEYVSGGFLLKYKER